MSAIARQRLDSKVFQERSMLQVRHVKRMALADIEAGPVPSSLAATHHGFTFYVAHPIRSIETRSLPTLTHVRPPISTFGLPIYVARVPAAPFTRSYPRRFTFYVADPIQLHSCIISGL